MGDLGEPNLDMPFERRDDEPLHDKDQAIVCGGVTVGAMVVDVPEVGPKPALLFRFVAASGLVLQPIVLVQDDEQLAKLRPLVLEAVATARREAALRGGRR